MCVASYLYRAQVHTVETDFKLFLSGPGEIHTALTFNNLLSINEKHFDFMIYILIGRERGRGASQTNVKPTSHQPLHLIADLSASFVPLPLRA